MATLNSKFLSFTGFLAASIVLVMIGGIWFGSSWIPSPWFWLIVSCCLAASLLSLIVWKIDSAYAGVELEPGDLADEDESEMKKGVPKPAARQAATAIAKAKQPMKVAGVVQKPVAKQIALPSKQPAGIQKEKVEVKADTSEQKPSAKVVPFLASSLGSKPVEPNKEGEKTNKLANQLASIPAREPEEAEQERETNDVDATPVVKVKLNRKNVQYLIAVYREEGYNAVSFSKFRNELGVGKDKEILKLKKLLLEAVAMGLLAKKGSRYIIQREGQEPLE